MIHKTRWLTLVLLFCLLGALTACGDNGSISTASNGDGGGGNGNHGTEQPQSALAEPLGNKVGAWCANATLSADHAVPGTTVTVRNVPKSFGPPLFRVIAQTADGGKAITPLLAIAGTPEDVVKFPAPLYPTGDPEGGEVTLELGDGDTYCQMAFTIDPLPKDVPADYALTIKNLLQQFADTVILKSGLDPAKLLQADPDKLPAAKLPAWVLKHLVSSNDPNALPATLKQVASDNDKTFERFLKAIHAKQALNKALIQLDTLPTATKTLTSPTPKAHRIAANRGIQFNTAGRSAHYAAPLVSASRSSGCLTFDVIHRLDIDNAADLSYAMAVAGAARRKAQKTLSKVSQALGAVALGATAGGLGEFVSAEIAPGLLMLFAASEGMAIIASYYPSTISKFKVRHIGTPWVEDRSANKPMHWEGAEVTAKGKPYSLSTLGVKALLQYGGLKSDSFGFVSGIVSTGAPKALNTIIRAGIRHIGACVKFRAPKYGPINVDSVEWSEDKIIGNSVKLIDQPRNYIGKQIGNSTLVIRLRGKLFGIPPNAVKKKFPIKVKKIDIELHDEFTLAQPPGETVTINATAANATTVPFDLKATMAGPGSITNTHVEGDFYVVKIKTPTDVRNYPTGVKFTWLGRTLPTASGDRKRTNKGKIGVRGITIEGDVPCLTPGDTFQLTAKLEGFPPGQQGVTWSTSGFSVTNGNGLATTVTAPNSKGPFTVTVTSDAKSSVADTNQYTVHRSCIKKIWYPTAYITLDGSGIYNPCVGSSEPIPEQKRSVESGQPVTPPNVPPAQALWFNRHKVVQANFSHTSTRHNYNIDTDNCMTVNLSGHNRSKVRYAGSPDGTLSLSMDVNNTTTCAAYPTGEVACVGTLTTATAIGYFYARIGSETTFNLSGQLSCRNMTGTIGIPGPIDSIRVGLYRFDDGQLVSIGTPKSRTDPTGLGKPTLVAVNCDDANPVKPFDLTFTLDAPKTKGKDLIVLQISGGMAATAAYIPKSLLQSPTSFTPSGSVQPGTYQTTGNIDFSIKLERQ